ncbi:unnamed protein product [Phytophthora fragariaefolia]|uniref:Unnamed protein product n=1 Tax=Phytophthora fragariaefolia TaxID=1490495 RepID=A0A9W7CSW8_9STRA|nr:unnamed protein product [Phytophthora fragariaefolia]
MRDRVALQRRIHAEAIKALHDQIGRLASQVVTRQSSASTASPQQAQRIQQLEASLAQAQADREASEVALRQSQEDSHARGASQQALEASTQQLRRQIDTLERRLAHLRDEKDPQGTKLRAQLTRVEADRDQLSDQVDRLTAQVAAAAIELHRAIADRLHVDSARGAIARLEQRANDLQVDRDELQRLESSKATLAADLTAAQGARSAAESDRDRLQRELDDIRGQISGLMNLVRPTAASPCRPSSPSRRRRRSRSPSAGGDSSRPRRRARPSSSSPRGSSSASRPHSGSRSSPARNRPPSARGRSSSTVPPEAESSDRTTSEPDSALSSDSNAAPPADRVDPRDLVESSEDEVLDALARTHSEERRRPQANSRGSHADLPIDLNSSSSSSDSDPSGHPQSADPAPATSRRRTRSSRRGASGSASSRTPVGEEGGGHGDQAQDHQGANDEDGAGLVQHNQLPADSVLASLPATRIPRSQWVLGFRQRRH